MDNAEKAQDKGNRATGQDQENRAMAKDLENTARDPVLVLDLVLAQALGLDRGKDRDNKLATAHTASAMGLAAAQDLALATEKA